MSSEAMAWAWRQECKSSAEKLVLVALADHADNDGVCWPSSARLADRCGTGKTIIQRHLTALEERGLMTRARRRREDGTLGTYRYVLRCAQPADNHADGDGSQRALASGSDSTSGTPVLNQEYSSVTTRSTPVSQPGVLQSGAELPIELTKEHRASVSTDDIKAERKKRRTRVPDLDTLRSLMSEKDREKWKAAYANPRHELEQFHNHHTAKGSLMLDWRAALCTWVGNGYNAKRPAQSHGSGQPSWLEDLERIQRGPQ